AMNNCTDQQYWDTLVCQCIPCSLVCGRSTVRRCAALCESMDCNRRAGFYYDKLLLKQCINCTTVCGQHPKQCAPSCEKEVHSCFQILPKQSTQVPLATPFPYQRVNSVKHIPEGFLSTPISAWPTAGALVATPPPPAVLVTASPPAAGLGQVYLLLGLCLCALICSLLLGWTHLRRKGEVVSCQASAGTCHRREDSSKANTYSLFADRLVEAGSVGDGCTGSRVPEPVETCGFCFPGHSSAVQETKSGHSTSYHTGERAAPSHSGMCSTGSAGAVPSPDDGHFKIICSPSQEKTP
ncbi:Tumor necrosis factor receptor superfamily member 13B, partial [Fulmarus glacialis]